MSDTYRLPLRKARLCRIAGAAFLFLAACTAIEAAILAAWPVPAFDCKGGCSWKTRPAQLLDDDERATITGPAEEQALAAYVARPIVRVGIFGVKMIHSAPFAILLFGVGTALRHLGGRGDNQLERALPWLRRASLAAIVWAVAQPVSNSLMASLLSPGTPAGPYWYIEFDLVDILTALMMAIAAYATVWALEGGLRAQRELADFV
ncbi:hypothetical protein ACVOMT_13015 [Sphingomonas panni]|uniref:hypothetical protein n=1 Tax=uncultured Sphingomonas sp. TaxID=158754 RepID=UPI002585FA1E|nr:hypothetical protein [uncultured Sphingomonas sp.]